MPRRHKLTDNSNLFAKLSLRRYFLDKYHKGERFTIFDACQGDGIIWGSLRDLYDCQYWGVDVKKRKGKIRMDSLRILAKPDFQADVVDIDPYGQPWTHYLTLLDNLKRPATVFLTVGFACIGGLANMAEVVIRECGLNFRSRRVPNSILVTIRGRLDFRMLGAPWRRGLEVIEAAYLEGTSQTRYYGIRLEPADLGSAPQ